MAAAKKTTKKTTQTKKVEENIHKPFWIQLNFFASTNIEDAEDLWNIYDEVVDEAIRRGFYFDKGFVADAVVEEIPVDNEVHQQITGRHKK